MVYEKKLEDKLDKKLTIIILFIIISVGLFGNSLNLLVLSRRSMRKISTFRFLLYLSVIDLLVLLICSTDVLLTFGANIEIRLYSDFTCKLHTFLIYFLTHMSSIILMIVSIERVILVLKKALFNLNGEKINRKLRIACIRKNRVETILLMITIVLMLINIHYLFLIDLNHVKFKLEDELANVEQNRSLFSDYDAYKFIQQITHEKFKNSYNKIMRNQTISNPASSLINDQDVRFVWQSATSLSSIGIVDKSSEDFGIICFPSDETFYYSFLHYVWIWIDTFIYCGLPFIVMVISAIIILIKTHKRNRSFMKRFAKTNVLLGIKRKRQNNQMFVMLSFTNLFFISCSLPYCILCFKLYKGEETNAKFAFLVHILAYSNNAANFIFYGLFSQKYREELAKMFFNLKSERKNHSSSHIKSVNSKQIVTTNKANFFNLVEEEIKLF